MQEIVSTTKTVVETTVDVRYVEIEEGLFVYNRTMSEEVVLHEGVKRNVLSPRAVEGGFVDRKNLNKVLSGKPATKLPLTILSATIRETLRKTGWDYEAFKDIPSDYYQAIVSGAYGADDIVRLATDSHMLFDRHGNVLPVGIIFEYIGGRTVNTCFDLMKLAAHLMTRKDVVLYGRREGWKKDEPDMSTPATKPEDAILDIPYYNRDGGRSKWVCFTWMPNAEDYAKAWEKAKTLNKNYPSTDMIRAVWEIDLLGFREAGCALFDNYYESARSDSEEDSEEEYED